MQKKFLFVICLFGMMFLFNTGKVNAISLENLSSNLAIETIDVSNYFNVLAAPENCANYITADLAEEIGTIVMLLQLAAIVITVILGITEFAKATISEDADLKKGASKRFIRRIFIMVLILLVPAIVRFILFNFNIVTTDPLCNVVMAMAKGV